MKKILDLDRLHQARVAAATTWSWYFEGDRFFEGTRSLFTAGDIATPLVNAYRMLARLGDQRLHLESTAGRESDQLDDMPARAEVDGLAAWDGRNRITVLIWHHCDDQYRTGEARVACTLRSLPFEGRPVRLRHFRIDHAHSNSHSAWIGQGRPQAPDLDQLTEIAARGRFGGAVNRIAQSIRRPRTSLCRSHCLCPAPRYWSWKRCNSEAGDRGRGDRSVRWVAHGRPHDHNRQAGTSDVSFSPVGRNRRSRALRRTAMDEFQSHGFRDRVA